MTLSFYNPFIFSPQNDTLAYETNIGRSFLMKTAILMQSFQYFTIAQASIQNCFMPNEKTVKYHIFYIIIFWIEAWGLYEILILNLPKFRNFLFQYDIS